ncbi:MAG: DegT/DnrJ/EryC1/StrS family aminotransferase [Nitrospiraceae bacterium]
MRASDRDALRSQRPAPDRTGTGNSLIEDAACAIGSEILIDGGWQRIGRPHGDIACFSFHPRKVITAGEGGMLTTANAEYDRRFRLWRQHGMTVNDRQRHEANRVLFEDYDELGYNYRMTDLQAAVGRAQLRRLPQIVAQRRAIAARYLDRLSQSGLHLPVEPAWARSNWQSFCVGLPTECGQRETMQALLDAGIATRRGIMCAPRTGLCEGALAAGKLAGEERGSTGSFGDPAPLSRNDGGRTGRGRASGSACNGCDERGARLI